MTKVNAIQLFENNKVRTVWDEDQEKWFISLIDVIQILQNRSCRHRTTFRLIQSIPSPKAAPFNE